MIAIASYYIKWKMLFNFWNLDKKSNSNRNILLRIEVSKSFICRFCENNEIDKFK